jgi:hypothetical protein
VSGEDVKGQTPLRKCEARRVAMAPCLSKASNTKSVAFIIATLSLFDLF